QATLRLQPGCATEAAREAVRYAFDEAGLDEIISMTAERNTRSQAVMKRLGMTHLADFNHTRLSPDSPLFRHVVYHLKRP
ncbi:GNAT family N-acetyltransferase, partial [Nonomuraea sp. NPDC049784]|uniref:GNAT family N-acetyltransferase n=1 Tax=Nonomuraea sp. NPDC049784 TaxID=3154361 RepID=UPI0033F37483